MGRHKKTGELEEKMRKQRRGIGPCEQKGAYFAEGKPRAKTDTESTAVFIFPVYFKP
jgi:hypothetical protein